MRLVVSGVGLHPPGCALAVRIVTTVACAAAAGQSMTVIYLMQHALCLFLVVACSFIHVVVRVCRDETRDGGGHHPGGHNGGLRLRGVVRPVPSPRRYHCLQGC